MKEIYIVKHAYFLSPQWLDCLKCSLSLCIFLYGEVTSNL